MIRTRDDGLKSSRLSPWHDHPFLQSRGCHSSQIADAERSWPIWNGAWRRAGGIPL